MNGAAEYPFYLDSDFRRWHKRDQLDDWQARGWHDCHPACMNQTLATGSALAVTARPDPAHDPLCLTCFPGGCMSPYVWPLLFTDAGDAVRLARNVDQIVATDIAGPHGFPAVLCTVNAIYTPPGPQVLIHYDRISYAQHVIALAARQGLIGHHQGDYSTRCLRTPENTP